MARADDETGAASDGPIYILFAQSHGLLCAIAPGNSGGYGRGEGAAGTVVVGRFNLLGADSFADIDGGALTEYTTVGQEINYRSEERFSRNAATGV